MFFCGFNIVAVILAWVSEVSGDFIAAAAQLADEMITASYNAQQIPLFDSWQFDRKPSNVSQTNSNHCVDGFPVVMLLLIP